MHQVLRRQPGLGLAAGHGRITVKVLFPILKPRPLPLGRGQEGGGLRGGKIHRHVAQEPENLRSRMHEGVLVQAFARLPPSFEFGLKVREAPRSLEGWVIGLQGGCGFGELGGVLSKTAQEEEGGRETVVANLIGGKGGVFGQR